MGMIKRLSIRNKMILLTVLVLAMFGALSGFASLTINQAKGTGIEEAGKLMLADQKDKLRVATHTIALALGQLLQGVTDETQRIEIIRKAIDPIRFEEDKSGYYFVYSKTTCVALPPKKELQGKDLGELKDKNGVYLVRELRDKAQGGGGVRRIYLAQAGGRRSAQTGLCGNDSRNGNLDRHRCVYR
jgi:methyl-accepting chemotaxis protein